MIPPFTVSGGLPEGVHQAEMNEIEKRFSYNPRRLWLFGGLKRAMADLGTAGCQMLYLDGSFVTDKEFPGDFDACWDPKGVIIAKLDPVFLDFSNRRAAQKAKYFGEFFPAQATANATAPFYTFLKFFQMDTTTGIRKGIIGIKITRIL